MYFKNYMKVQQDIIKQYLQGKVFITGSIFYIFH